MAGGEEVRFVVSNASDAPLILPVYSRPIVSTSVKGGDVKSNGSRYAEIPRAQCQMTLRWCELQWKHASSVGWQITRPLADNIDTHVRWLWQPFNLRFTSAFWKLVASKKQGFSFFLLLCRALACSVSCLNAMSCSQHRWHERHTELWRKTQGTHLGACRMTLWWNKLNVHTATLQHCCNLLSEFSNFGIYLFYFILATSLPAADISERRLNGFPQTLVSTRNLRA